MLTTKVHIAALSLVLAINFCQIHREIVADVVELEDGKNSKQLGDFECSTCPNQIMSSIGILEQGQSGSVRAGDLWKFFHDQGVDSLNRLTLCLDVQELDHESKFNLESVKLTIEGPLGRAPLTEFSFNGDSLIVPVPAEGTASIKPEARLEIQLGYDFMERFSATSQEKVELIFESHSSQAGNAKFLIEADNNVFSKANALLLVAFVAFWIVVFVTLNRITKPVNEDSPQPNTPPTGLTDPQTAPKKTKRAMSA